MPDDMHITVHYVRSPVVNAMATLGGHIIMFEGLFKRLHSEDAVAMLQVRWPCLTCWKMKARTGNRYILNF
ncbi:MAG: hypothetical protein Q9M24_04925 [Mariprofundaceae bacterium]|nr:hypothetical protein [Mariprofundaceae bacterium]